MLWVGMDTHYGLYDPGYREKSLSMDTVGNSASTLYQQISFSAVSVGAERNRRISNYHRIT